MTDQPTDAQGAADMIASLDDTSADNIYRATYKWDMRGVAAAAASAAAGGGGATSPEWAQVRLTAAIASNPSDTAIPFNAVDYDPAGLWDAEFDQYTCQTAGWYRVWTATTSTSAAFNIPAGATGTYYLTAQVYGAGNNIINRADRNPNSAVSIQHIDGVVHLDAGDGLALVTDTSATPLITVGPGVTFTLELLTAT
jgi:hypothetical protein